LRTLSGFFSETFQDDLCEDDTEDHCAR
jgi:hypothetical protein